jgi:DNA-binding NtrC family response regulator
MKHVVVSWIGKRDLDAVDAEAGDGPVLATLRTVQPDQTYLLYNYPPANVAPYLDWLGNRAPGKLNARHAQLSSPVDYSDIYKAAEALLHEVWTTHPEAKRQILISPGTPAMQAVWILLGKTRYQADFLQASAEQGVQPVDLPFAISAEFLPLGSASDGLRLREMAAAPVPMTADFERIVTGHPNLMKLKQRAAALARFDVPVLLLGETGTGKELFARAIHNISTRSGKPFVALNCGAIPPELIDSTLFGHLKGAFTGAVRNQAGVFEQAQGGTLFLDELGELSASAQVRLLRVLQEGEVRPLGSTDTHKVDVRIVAATHHNLRNLVEEGRFREDLFYRLAQFPIELPALREREQDILTLARHFADKASAFLQRDPCRWADRTLDHMAGYAFPGNVRELKGLVERAVLLCEGGELLPEHFNLRQDSNPDDNGMNLRERMERVERSLLLDCLRKNRGNQTSAACELGLPRRTLLYRMQRLNISPADV